MSLAILSRDTNTITVANFYENYLLNKYNFEPPYQRKSVWTDEKQSFFIDSILKNFPIPPIFLHQHIDDKTGITNYDVIDGKQRLSSIIRFIKNEIPVSNEFEENEEESTVEGAYFYDLDKSELSEFKKRFWRYLIPIEYIDTTTPEVIDNIFDRLNRNGEPLRGQELRNAKYHGTPLLTLVEELATLPFWKERLEHVDLARMENTEFISELIFVLLENGPQAALPKILDALYDKYTRGDEPFNGLTENFQDITDFLIGLDLDYEHNKIKGVSHLYGLWCLAWFCLGLELEPQEIVAKLNTFFTDLRTNYRENAYVEQYKITMSSNTKSKNMRERRLDALLKYCEIVE